MAGVEHHGGAAEAGLLRRTSRRISAARSCRRASIVIRSVRSRSRIGCTAGCVRLPAVAQQRHQLAVVAAASRGSTLPSGCGTSTTPAKSSYPWSRTRESRSTKEVFWRRPVGARAQVAQQVEGAAAERVVARAARRALTAAAQRSTPRRS